MRLCCLLLFYLLFTSCGSKSIENKNAGDVNTGNDSLLPASCIPANFTTRLGTKVMYTRVGNEVKLSWGNNTYTRSHDSLFTCADYTGSGRWDFIPKYDAETKNHLIFTNVLSTSSGGNPAPIDFSVLVLPKNTVDSIYQKDMYIKSHKNYIIYVSDSESFVESLDILNVETKKKQVCTLSPQSVIFARSPTFVIQSTVIKNKMLHVEYETYDENLDSIIIVKNKFRLTI